jgi:hypothetical protein
MFFSITPYVELLAAPKRFFCLKKSKKIGGNVEEYKAFRLIPLTPPLQPLDTTFNYFSPLFSSFPLPPKVSSSLTLKEYWFI